MYFRRVRHLTWRQLLAAIVPRQFDFFVIQGNARTLAAAPPVTTFDSLTIERYNAEHKAGIPVIDAYLYGRREAFVARVNGVIAHRVVLSFDYMRLAQFGCDPESALVAEGYTEPEFRGKGLQAFMRRYVLEDTLKRGLAPSLCGEIRTDNIASIKGNARGGLPVIARVQGIKFAGMLVRRRITPMSVQEASELALRARATSR
jgi:GNAT superfamily N-acetyltransferase